MQKFFNFFQQKKNCQKNVKLQKCKTNIHTFFFAIFFTV